MDLLTPLVNAVPLLILSSLVVFYMRGRFERLEADVKDLRHETRELRSEMNGRFEQVAREMAGLRSDLTHVALAVGARTRPEAGSA